jgi:hypothetical protein
MTKKIKIKDLEDDPNLPKPKEERTSQVMDWGDVERLPEDEISIEPKNTPKENLEVREKPRQVVEKLVYFKRNFLVSYFTKCFSVFLVFVTLDFISHIMKFFDGVNVTDFSNFQSIFLGGGTNWVICKLIGFLIGVYFISNKDNIVANKKGLYCVNPEITDTIFFTPKNVFIPWEQMSKVKLKMRLFEPYLFFYDNNDNKLGHLEFSVESREKFFSYIESNTGKTHPLVLIKSNSLLI